MIGGIESEIIGDYSVIFVIARIYRIVWKILSDYKLFINHYFINFKRIDDRKLNFERFLDWHDSLKISSSFFHTIDHSSLKG